MRLLKSLPAVELPTSLLPNPPQPPFPSCVYDFDYVKCLMWAESHFLDIRRYRKNPDVMQILHFFFSVIYSRHYVTEIVELYIYNIHNIYILLTLNYIANINLNIYN